jgi:alpha-tubulin suppressor-like RCC1 family protein
MVQPGPVTAGQAFAPAVTVAVQDPAGNTVTGATNPVSLAIGTNAGSGTLSGVTTVLAVNGVASFSGLSIDKSGTGYTLVAASPGLGSATSTPFAVAAGPASLLGFTVQPSGALTGTPISPAVAVGVRDLFGNLITSATHSVTIGIGANPGSGTLSGPATVAAINGVATFPGLSIDRAGTGYTLTATAAGLTPGISAGFTIRDPLIYASISAGYFHSCGLTTGGAAWCWGENAGGQLGNSGASPSTVPVQVAGGLGFAGLSAGRTHTCAVTPGGAGYCWGDNALGSSGSSTARTPRAVAGTLTFARVIAGYAHSCGVTTGGAGYCWGAGGLGELGNGTTISSPVPVPVSGGLAFASISPGRSFTCGLTTAGKAYCWGSGSSGQLGDGTLTSQPIPVAVSSQLTFALVSAGGFHACGLSTGGQAYCWGWNEFGQLGGGGPGGFSTTPQPVGGGLTFATLSAGNRHTCGVTTAGVGYCWGDNLNGMLGTGIQINSSVPAPVAGGLSWAAISAGRFHSCGVTTAGVAYCWGAAGALGDGTNQGRVVPTRVF